MTISRGLDGTVTPRLPVDWARRWRGLTHPASPSPAKNGYSQLLNMMEVSHASCTDIDTSVVCGSICESFKEWAQVTQADKALVLRCSMCKKDRPSGWFQRSGVGRRLSWCRDCVRGKQARHGAVRRGAGVVGKLTQDVCAMLYLRQGGVCALCARPLGWPVLKSVHVDHIVPVSKGGRHEISNLQVTHARCNLIKGNRYSR